MIIDKINRYNELATEDYNSNNDRNDISNMFKIYVTTLENTAEQVRILAKSESDKALQDNLIGISEKYMDLSNRFEKGEF